MFGVNSCVSKLQAMYQEKCAAVIISNLIYYMMVFLETFHSISDIWLKRKV